MMVGTTTSQLFYGYEEGVVLRIFLCSLWIAYVLALLMALVFSWKTFEPNSSKDAILVFTLIATTLAPLCSKIMGVIAIVKRCRGVAWQDQSSLLQVNAVFTISALTVILFTYAFIAIDTMFLEVLGVTKYFTFEEFLPLEWLVNAFAYMYFGLGASAMTIITWPIMTPPIIVLILLVRNKPLTKRMAYTLTSISTLGWLIISVIGLAVLSMSA